MQSYALHSKQYKNSIAFKPSLKIVSDIKIENNKNWVASTLGSSCLEAGLSAYPTCRLFVLICFSIIFGYPLKKSMLRFIEKKSLLAAMRFYTTVRFSSCHQSHGYCAIFFIISLPSIGVPYYLKHNVFCLLSTLLFYSVSTRSLLKIPFPAD